MRYLIYGFVAVLCLAMVAAVHVKKVLGVQGRRFVKRRAPTAGASGALQR